MKNMKFKMKYELDNGEKGCVPLEAVTAEAANGEADRLVSERPEVCGYTVVQAKERTPLRHNKSIKVSNKSTTRKEKQNMKTTKKTPEEIKAARNAASKRWYEKQKAAKMAQNGGVAPRRGRPPKSASVETSEVKPAAAKPARKAAKRAMCASGKKACKCAGGCKCKELKKLEKSLVKAQAAYDKALNKAMLADGLVTAAKTLIKDIKLAIKAQKTVIKAEKKTEKNA